MMDTIFVSDVSLDRARERIPDELAEFGEVWRLSESVHVVLKASHHAVLAGMMHHNVGRDRVHAAPVDFSEIIGNVPAKFLRAHRAATFYPPLADFLLEPLDGHLAPRSLVNALREAPSNDERDALADLIFGDPEPLENAFVEYPPRRFRRE